MNHGKVHMGLQGARQISQTSKWMSRQDYLKWGVLGGFIGAIFMALVMIGAVQAAMGDGVAVVCSMGVALIGLQPTSTATTTLGLIIHLIMGIVIGVILVTASFVIGHQLLIKNVKKGVSVGLLGGFIVYLVLGLPILFYVMVPAMIQVLGMMGGAATMAANEADAMMMINSLMAPLLGAWLVAHLVYGATWGAFVGHGATRKIPIVK